MSRNGQRLPIPSGSRLAGDLAKWVEAWPTYEVTYPHPRSVWLREVEHRLSVAYPDASRADLNLTARGIAPFPLADGPDVP